MWPLWVTRFLALNRISKKELINLVNNVPEKDHNNVPEYNLGPQISLDSDGVSAILYIQYSNKGELRK